jgi:catechol 2,3-dioxygenase-like lactoylglutathione lyase family enzyme
VLRGIDHVVIVVKNLSQTIRDYEQLGFTVIIGGEHAHRGSHNALILFQDGSYVELIAFRHEPRVKDNCWWDFLQTGEGLVDYALLSDNLAAELERLRARGLNVTDPMDGGRARPDGIRVAWRIGRVDGGEAGHLPFLIDDATDRELRVPIGDTAVHPNGVIGIERVTVAVPSVAVASPIYQTLLSDAGTTDAAAEFSAGRHVIQLADPQAPDHDIARFIARRGSGPYRVTLRRGEAACSTVTTDLDPHLTHSAHLMIA